MIETDENKINEVFEKIAKHGNEKVASGLKDAIRHYEETVNTDGGGSWNTFIAGYLMCLKYLDFIDGEDIGLFYALLFEKYVYAIKNRHN